MRDPEELREALRAQPFRPFEVKLVDGTSYLESHPDYLHLPPVPRPHHVTFYAMLDGGDYREHWIDIGVINEVICPPRASSAS
jgi:hypothetical protein